MAYLKNEYKYLLLVFLIIHPYILFSQSLEIESSRISGVAPLYVFFDATSSIGLDEVNDLPNADFSWNFDVENIDENGNWEETKGMVAGHVFEVPGIYTVRCNMRAKNGVLDTKEVIITVSEFSGTTYYVSNGSEASDANDGLTQSTPWETANYALSNLTTNTRILFRRGDVFYGVDQLIENLNSGVKIIGAYGTGSNPIIINALGNPVIDIDNCNDVIVMDLHLIINNFASGEGDNRPNRGFRAQESSNILALRLEMENVISTAITQDNGDTLGIFDCNLHDIGALGIFSGDSRRLSWVGNSIDVMETPQPEHCMRLQRGEKQFVAHSTFTNLLDVKTSITVRGDGQRHIMIYKNKMDRIVQIAPTDHNVIQFVSLATIEANYIGQNPDYSDTNFSPSISAINLISNEIVVRNNVFDGVRRGLSITVEHPAVIPSNIDIYNNTMNWRSVMDASGDSGTMVSCNNAVNVNIRNNLMSAPNVNEMNILGGNGNTNLVKSNNLMSLAPGFIEPDLPGSAAHLNSAGNFELNESSPAINQGALDVPVYFDQKGSRRYYGSAPDLGAFEFYDGGELTNPDTGNLSISEIEIFKIHPNPTSSVLILDNKFIGYKVSVISLNGKVIKVYSSLNHIEIDVSYLPIGMYLLKIEGDKNYTGRFIKK